MDNIAQTLKRILEEHPKAAPDFGSQMMYNDEYLSIVGDMFGSRTIVASEVQTGKKLFVGNQKGSAVSDEGDWLNHVENILSQIDEPEASSGQGQVNLQSSEEGYDVPIEKKDVSEVVPPANPENPGEPPVENTPVDSGVTPANGQVTPGTDELPKQETSDPASHVELPDGAAWPA